MAAWFDSLPAVGVKSRGSKDLLRDLKHKKRRSFQGYGPLTKTLLVHRPEEEWEEDLGKCVSHTKYVYFPTAPLPHPSYNHVTPNFETLAFSF